MVNKKLRQKKKIVKQKARIKAKKEFENSLDFPFIKKDNVVEYITRSKVMFVMRGLPGSGKSTLVKELLKKYNCVVCSADNFFENSVTGKYEFDENLLKDAHSYCQQLALACCEQNNHVIIVDNTNVMKWEMKFYLQQAVVHNYVVVIVTPQTSWCLDAQELAKRNTHGVSEEILRKKIKIFKDMIPLYYGWFWNESDSNTLLELGTRFHQMSLKYFPGFRNVLQDSIDTLESDVNGTPPSLQKYYSRLGSSGILHCTSKFCRWGKEPGSKEYHGQIKVKDACGNVFKLTVTGIVLTPRTISARIQLDKRQLRLWENDKLATETSSILDGCNSSRTSNDKHFTSDDFALRKESSRSMCNDSQSQTTAFCQNLDEKINFNKSLAQNSFVSKNPFDALQTEETVEPALLNSVIEDLAEVKLDKGGNSEMEQSVFATGLSAHITLGYAKGYRAQQSGPDIINLLQCSNIKGPSVVRDLDDAVMNYYEDGLCEVILKTPRKFESIFSGFY